MAYENSEEIWWGDNAVKLTAEINPSVWKKKKMCLTWQILFSLLFLSWSSLFYPPLPFFFLLSSILCSFSQFTFLSLFSLCLCLPIFLAWIFRVFFFPHVITHPSDMSQYCMEVHCRHILVSCCYVFNPSKLTFLYHSFSAQKEAKLKCFWFLYSSICILMPRYFLSGNGII